MDQKYETGVVFYKFRSAYANFITAVTKQPFSDVGFFYKTTIFGPQEYVVLSMDLFGLNRPKIGDPNMTLEKLQNSPKIEKLAIRPLNHKVEMSDETFQELERNFRYLMSTIEAEPASPEATVADVFGMKYPMNNNEKTPIQLINEIIIALTDKFSSNCEPKSISWNNIKLPSKLSDNEIGRLQLAALIGTPFYRNSETPGIDSILSENQIFGDLIYLPLPEHSEAVIKKHILDVTSSEAFFMQKFSETFVSMLFRDRDFLTSVIEGVNNGRSMLSKGQIVEKAVVDKLLESGKDLIETINHGLNEGTVEFKELQKIINTHRNNLKFLGDIKGVDHNLPVLTTIYSNHCIAFEVNESADGIKSNLNSVMLGLEQCASDLRSNNKPNLDIAQVCSLLSKLTGQTISMPDGKHGVILISNPSSSKVHLDKDVLFVYPTTTSEELRKLNQTQLQELDRHLYSLPHASEFEGVRSRIASLLN